MRIIVLFFCLLIFTIEAFSCEKDKIILAWDPFAPYQIGDESTVNPKGIVIDLTLAAAEKIGCKKNIVFEYLPWKRALIDLEKGKIDIAPNAAKTPEREKYAYFKRYFLASSNAIFVDAKDLEKFNKMTFEEILNIKHFVIGYTHAYNYGDISEKMKTKYPNSFEMALHDDLSIGKISKGRVNAFLGDVALTRELIRDLKAQKKLSENLNYEPLNIPLISAPKHAFFMYSKKSMPESLVNKFDQAMYDLYKEGVTEKIFLKYMSKRDTGFYVVEPKEGF